jgi:hypothetical protein
MASDEDAHRLRLLCSPSFGCVGAAATAAQHAWTRAGTRCGTHLPPALACLLVIALLCHALAAAATGTSARAAFHALAPRSRLAWWLRPPTTVPPVACAFNLTIRREMMPGGAAPRVTVNGASPGPVLRCALGRPLAITVVNELPPADGGTTIHWHGVRQRGTPWADGVPGLTQARRQRHIIPLQVCLSDAGAAHPLQCPIPSTPGANALVYQFTPDRAGTFWCARGQVAACAPTNTARNSSSTPRSRARPASLCCVYLVATDLAAHAGTTATRASSTRTASLARWSSAATRTTTQQAARSWPHPPCMLVVTRQLLPMTHSSGFGCCPTCTTLPRQRSQPRIWRLAAVWSRRRMRLR